MEAAVASAASFASFARRNLLRVDLRGLVSRAAGGAVAMSEVLVESSVGIYRRYGTTTMGCVLVEGILWKAENRWDFLLVL